MYLQYSQFKNKLFIVNFKNHCTLLHLALESLSNTIVLVKFDILLRFRLSSDQRQIFGADRTAHTVHYKKVVGTFSEMFIK
jgi:hypothetical protein